MSSSDVRRSEPMSTSRVEAFSDAVIAVAITLLVLDLRVPEPEDGQGLGEQLAAMWPNYAAYVISFVAIGIMWISHHTMMRRLSGVDHSVLVLNLFLLMCFVALPFTTSLLATYVDQPRGGHLAAIVYAGSFLVTSTVFAVLQSHLLLRRPADGAALSRRARPDPRRRRSARRLADRPDRLTSAAPARGPTSRP
jgi:uncharacterized membrane protein